MTPDEKAANVALLARVVMGWTQLASWGDRRQPDCFVMSKSGDGHAIVERGNGSDAGWYPYVSIADAMEMLDRCEMYRLTKMGPAHICGIRPDGPRPDDPVYSANADSRCGAICAACLEWARAQGERG